MLQSQQLSSIFPVKGWQHWETNESWQLLQEKQEKNPRKGQSRNTSVPRINEENITQVSEEIEGRVIENCPSSSAGQSPAFWVLCLN